MRAICHHLLNQSIAFEFGPYSIFHLTVDSSYGKRRVLQLELDILKMRSNLERRTPPASPNPLINTSPVTKDEILIEVRLIVYNR